MVPRRQWWVIWRKVARKRRWLCRVLFFVSRRFHWARKCYVCAIRCCCLLKQRNPSEECSMIEPYARFTPSVKISTKQFSFSSHCYSSLLAELLWDSWVLKRGYDVDGKELIAGKFVFYFWTTRTKPARIRSFVKRKSPKGGNGDTREKLGMP